MKLYQSIGPNPRAVKIFIAEKGLDVPRVEIDLPAGENRQASHLARNPSGQTPTLELEDGACLAEITAICEYLEEKQPNPPLIGSTPEERAETRMWTRRVDIRICEPMANGFRFGEGLAMFRDRVLCVPEASAGLKAMARNGEEWLEAQFKGPWICGERFTMADIVLFSFIEFGGVVGQPLGPGLPKLAAWFDRVKARPSVSASA
jgi:glutathione S-transferase